MTGKLPQMDILTGLLVSLLHLIKFFRRQPTPLAKARQRILQQEQRIKLKLPPHMQLQEKTVADVNCSFINNSKADKGHILLHLHGGAMCLRMIKGDLATVAPYVEQTNINAVLPHYRLAPENKFPAGLDDCFAVYQQLLDDGFQSENIILSGISAGGGYSLALLMMIKEHNLPMPGCAILMSPSGDALNIGPSFYENGFKDPLFYSSDLAYYQNLLLAPDQVADPRLNVSLMESFEGYPPLFLTASSHEVLRDIAVMAADKAEQAGVPYQLDIFHKGFHAIYMAPTPMSKQIWQRIYQFTQQHYGPAQA